MGNGGTLNKAVFYIDKVGETLTGYAYAKIYLGTGVYGLFSKPTGEPLATSEAFDVSILTSSKELIDFVFTGENKITLTNDVMYAVTLEFTGGTASNDCLGYSIDHTDPTHSGNRFIYTDDWGTQNTTDMIFYVYKDLFSESASPSKSESVSASISPSKSESKSPSVSPSVSPSKSASLSPSVSPSISESLSPSQSESVSPSVSASISPSISPSVSSSISESVSPSLSESRSPSISPSVSESTSPSVSASRSASKSPSKSPSVSPSVSESVSPSVSPSSSPSVFYEGILYRWDGANWVKAKLQNYNGLAFESKPLYFWDDISHSWKLVDTSG
jgi:hypothetical protein